MQTELFILSYCRKMRRTESIHAQQDKIRPQFSMHSIAPTPFSPVFRVTSVVSLGERGPGCIIWEHPEPHFITDDVLGARGPGRRDV